MAGALNDQRRGGPRRLGDGGGKAQAGSPRPSGHKKVIVTPAQFGIKFHDLNRRALEITY